MDVVLVLDGGGAGLTNIRSAAGGGYGGIGGGPNNGTTCDAGVKGPANGSQTTLDIDMGSGGGGGGSGGGDLGCPGGRGGGLVYLSANTLTHTGVISVNGAGGSSCQSGGGGGSGGGIMFVGCVVVISGIRRANGGNGNHIFTTQQGGGGGRIKTFYRTLNSAGSTTTVTPGNGNAVIGTIHTDEIAQCTSALAFGQAFTPGNTAAMAVNLLKIWVLSVATSGDFTCTIYDDTAKSNTLGSETITISSTGETIFYFSPWVRLADGSNEYYLEIVADAGGDIDLGIYGNTNVGDLYWNGDVVSYFDAYFDLQVVAPNTDIEVYNVADTSVKCHIANEILSEAVHRINADGTGTVEYNDDFSTDKWLADYEAMSGVTHDTGNDELDIADDGYIYYKIDTRYPINGIPTLTSRINITSGTPTIQISIDGSTWYDIDTSIVDDVETTYPLDSDENLSLAGRTVFYFRHDCVKATPATCSIKYFELDIDIHSIYAKNPKIFKGDTASTFRCDQGDSGMTCTVDLIFKNKWWV